MKLIRKAPYVSIFALPVALIGVLTLRYQLPIGPIILSLTLIPMEKKRKVIFAVDGIVNLVLGAILLFFPAGLVDLLGLPATSTSFYCLVDSRALPKANGHLRRKGLR